MTVPAGLGARRAPDPAARPPAGRPGDPPRTIGVLAPFVGGFYFGGVLSGAARAAAAERHPVLAVQTFPAGLDPATTSSRSPATRGSPPRGGTRCGWPDGRARASSR